VAPTPSFRIETASDGSGITIKLAGELDSATYPLLVERFDQLAGAGGSGEVVVDLTDVSFIDSAGMRAIIVIERSAQEREIPLVLRPAPGPVTELLLSTGVGGRVAPTPQAGDPPQAPFVERIELELERDPGTPGRARAELREAIAGRLGEPESATLTLLTSELVTNSVIHPDPDAGGTIGLRITTFADRVRVEVSDAGSGFEPAPLEPRPHGAGGHGLFVVDGLATRWGTRRVRGEDGERFCVWFELEVEGGIASEPDAGTAVEPPAIAAEG
jgi:anti-anti-sigma factor